MGNSINTDKYIGIGLRGIIAPSIDSSAAAFIAAAGITGAVQQTAINNLVTGLKTDGLWSKMKAVYPFVTDNRNLASYTESFDNPYWVKFNSTVTANATTAPNGTLTADKLLENGAGYHTCSFANNLITSTNPYTLSFYAKASERTWCSVYLFDGTVYEAFFDLANGVIGSISSGMTATITSVGNGWYRCSATRSITVSASSNGGIITALGNNQSSYTGTGGNGIFIWGAQLELNSTATTYQPIATTQQAYIASQFKYNLVNPVDSDAAFRLVFNGGWTHSSTGATPNGTNGYADTKLVPSSVLSSANNMSFGYYSRTIGGAAETRMSMGGFDGGSDSSLIIRWNNGFSYNNLNETLYTALYTNADTHGFYVANRNATNLEQGWKNGIKKIEVVNTPTTRTNKNVYLGAMNNNTAPLYFDNKQTAFSSIGDGLTDTESANLYTRVQAYQTSLSRNI